MGTNGYMTQSWGTSTIPAEAFGPTTPPPGPQLGELLGGAVQIVLPSTDTTGAADTLALQRAVAALGGTGGTVYMTAGIFYVKTGQLTILQSSGTVFLAGAGIGSTVIYAIGGGDTIRMYNPVSPPGGFTGLTVYGGGVLDLTIDGSLASPGAVGLHIGDGEHYQVRVQIQHFNGAGSVGLWIDNSVWWTEKGMWQGVFVDCTTAVQQTKTGGTATNSNAENDFDWIFFLKPSQNAIVMQGISHYIGRLKCRGVFNMGAGNTGVWLTADATSSINYCLLDVAVNTGSTGALGPQTMNTSNGFSFLGNYGRLVFYGGNWVPGNVTWANNQSNYHFAGEIIGDANIAPASVVGGTSAASLVLAGSPVVYAQGSFIGSTGHINDFMGDFFTTTLSANITVGLGGGSQGSTPGPQRKTIIIKQAAAGGPWTVTWPTNGAPTTTAPTVIWPGGSAPAMPAAAGAVMIVELATLDGATWYGWTPSLAPSAPVGVQPADPTGTTSTVAVMMGLGQAGGQAAIYTPTGTGLVAVTVTGYLSIATGVAICQISGRWGTPASAAPANGAALTGTRFGGSGDQAIRPSATGSGQPFALTGVLAIGAGNSAWVDLSLLTGSSSDLASLHSISVTFVEVA
jgi:hypothetical protein